jgi:4-carboxymuconolactone decarboxylase
MDKALYQKGLETFYKLHGGHEGEAILNELKEISSDYVDMFIEWSFGAMNNRPHLDLKTRMFLVIGSCVTLGTAVPQLHAHIEAALTLGATQEEIIEVILQMAFYAGFPATTNSLQVAHRVFKAWKKPKA